MNHEEIPNLEKENRLQNNLNRITLNDLKNHKLGFGCITLFFLPFIIMGVGSLCFIFFQFYKVHDAKTWKPTPAKMLSADYISRMSSGGRGGTTTTHDVIVSYEYELGKETYRGNVLSFNSGTNSVDNYSALYDSLNSANVIQVYVNESTPTESVIIRDVTNSMVTLIVFSCMLNTLLLVFLLPMFFKKLKARQILIFTIVIWVLCMTKMILHIGDIDISKDVIILESKEEIIYVD